MFLQNTKSIVPSGTYTIIMPQPKTPDPLFLGNGVRGDMADGQHCKVYTYFQICFYLIL